METLWKAKEIGLRQYILCKGIDASGNPTDITASFTNHDTVYAWLSITNASIGDKVTWLFKGPQNISEMINYTINWSNDGVCYASLSLSKYKQAAGDWNIVAYLNGKEVGIAYFEVKAKPNKTIGFEIIMPVLAILILLLIRRKK